jgi:hypothetical protein
MGCIYGRQLASSKHFFNIRTAIPLASSMYDTAAVAPQPEVPQAMPAQFYGYSASHVPAYAMYTHARAPADARPQPEASAPPV